MSSVCGSIPSVLVGKTLPFFGKFFPFQERPVIRWLNDLLIKLALDRLPADRHRSALLKLGPMWGLKSASFPKAEFKTSGALRLMMIG
jgi:hypothetical protein